ncbi:response regulator transcription factor [Bacillus carboniphilus]|uniref:Response regulator transcription factor n=1 Tax=Bacillus carboniphilus TaxID=86663 RepID=A0ABY9JWE4_9BACI|nr:response regulator transcription factor [Bacillus carboniphilus]WLR42735.1 response regulator transcription factor [Bacillus carboniphilus]
MNNPLTILIVDDEPEMRELIELNLLKEGYNCITAANGKEALKIVTSIKPNLILLDVMMPEMDGFTVAEKILENEKTPIIFLTARGDEWDRIYGLKLGAEDYIVKPFSPGELVARVEVVLRRFHVMKHPSEGLTIGGLEFDLEGRTVKLNSEPISLTLKEFELLHFLAKNKGRVFDREQLLEKIWGYDYSGSARTVDTHIKTLRLKMKDNGNIIKTVWGIGYKFVVDE